MYSLEVYQTMQKALVQVQTEVNNGGWSISGICEKIYSNLIRMTSNYTEQQVIQRAFLELIKQWPEYSGDQLYPIGQSSEDGYFLYVNVPSYWTQSEESWMWAKTSAYGRKRRELLAWLINRCEEITGQVI